MKAFELFYLFLEPFLPPLYRKTRRQLRAVARVYPERPRVLDVGGRKSHYTIGIPADVTIMDVPRTSVLQRKLNLGMDDAMRDQIFRRRSNVVDVVYQDITQTSLPNDSFDCVVAVEVLEHVERDDVFLGQVARVLKPGGVFLLTTPNGDFVENKNPDHKRHYTKEDLVRRLTDIFGAEVHVEYAVRGGRFRKRGLASWSLRRPLTTAGSMAGNLVNSLQSRSPRVSQQAAGTHHLFARAGKRG